MNRLLAVSSIALAIASIAWRPAPTARHAPTRNFVWLRRGDTLLRESFIQTGDAITGDMASGAQRIHYEGHLASPGKASRFDLRMTGFHRITHQLTLVLRDDSAFVIEHAGRYDDTVRLASKPNAIPILSPDPVGSFELIVQRARAQKTSKADVPVLIVSVDNANDIVIVPFTVAFPSRDTAVISVKGDEKVRFAIDAGGNILGGASPRLEVTIAPTRSSRRSTKPTPSWSIRNATPIAFARSTRGTLI